MMMTVKSSLSIQRVTGCAAASGEQRTQEREIKARESK